MRSLFALALLLAACEGAPPPAPPGRPDAEVGPSLKFELSADKDAVKKGDSIRVRARLTNVSNRPVFANTFLRINSDRAFPEDREIVFTILNTAGARLKFLSYIRPVERHDSFTLLQPGGSAAKEIELTRWFSFASPDRYLVQAFYENVQDPSRDMGGQTPWKGKLFSNTLVISVTD